MNNNICPHCGQLVNNQDYCPFCNNSLLIQNPENEVDAVIESVVDDILDSDRKIINKNEKDKFLQLDNNFTIIRNSEKCINCGQCLKTCESCANLQYDLNKIEQPLCIHCGQCILNCPVNAIFETEKYKKVKEIIDLNEQIVVALVEPYVSSFLSNILKTNVSNNMLNEMLKKIGFDYVFNNTLGYDILTLEDTYELINRKKNNKDLPLISSSCDSFINYCNLNHKELRNNFSTCDNSLEIHSNIIKNIFCAEKGFLSSKITTVGISSCNAKKNINNNLDLDYVISINELICLLNEINLDLLNYSEEESEINNPKYGMLGEICNEIKDNLIKRDKKIIGTEEKLNEIIIKYEDKDLKLLKVNGIDSFERLLSTNKLKEYDYIEVSVCQNGCIGGSGITMDSKSRNEVLINIQSSKKNMNMSNKLLKETYEKYLESPISNKSLMSIHKKNNFF